MKKSKQKKKKKSTWSIGDRYCFFVCLFIAKPVSFAVISEAKSQIEFS